MKNSLDFFEKIGIIIEAKGNAPLLLDNPEKVWIVKSGQLDIFYIQIKDKKPIGPRHHIFRAFESEALFGIKPHNSDENMGVLAVGIPGTSLIECKKSQFIDLLKDKRHFDHVEALLYKWIDNLFWGITKDEVFPKRFKDIETGAEISVEESTNFRTPKKSVWIKSVEGSLILADRQDWPKIPAQTLFPFSKEVWIHSEDKAHFFVFDTNTVLKEDQSLIVLDNIHNYVLECIIINNRLAENIERTRLIRKRKTDRLNFANAILGLGSILEVKKERLILEKGVQAPLLSACQIICKFSGIPVRFPQRPDKGSQEEILLEDIAHISGFRTRKVLLRDEWWRHDNGPLLAYYENEENRQPVALIPASPKKYDLCDTVKGTKKRVTRDVASSLAPEAYAFYRPFPEKELSGIDLIKFGVRGTLNDILMLLFLGILGALLGLLTPIMTGILFNSIIPEAAHGQLVQITVILIASAIAVVMFDITRGISLLRVEGKLDYSVQAAVWDRLLSLPVPFFRDYTAGDLAKRALGINQIRAILSGTTINTILSCLFSGFNLILLFYYDWQLAIVGIGLSIIEMVIISIISYFTVRYQRKIDEIEGKISGIILQLITGIPKLRVSGTEDRAFSEWAKNFTDKKRLAYKSGVLENIIVSFNSTLPVISSIAIFSWVIFKSTGRGLSTGSFLAFNTAYINFQTAMLQMAATLITTLNIIPLYERVKPIIQTLPESDETKAKPGELSGDIEVRNVFFRYHPEGSLILKDVSLKVSPGEFIAIVGGSGSGKSTLFRCLLGFESPELGTIYYDNQDLASLDIREVRRQIGVVFQNAKLMPGDIFKNIIGASNLTIDDAWEAARMVGLDEDIKEMPMGMHTVVSAGGGTFSGGQRQRLIIARAVVKRPRILYFDEATSALDNRTQAIVSRSLERLQVTRIVIAHRLSTIINADRIYVLQQGEIIETGTYESLMAKEGFFANLAKRQLA